METSATATVPITGPTGACDRIEAAIARIERALAAATPDQDLQRRHELLREAAASSLLMIDSLISSQEHEPPR